MTFSPKNKLSLEHISKQFDDTYAIDDVSLHVNEGEFVSIIGPSGCGKSTLLNMVAGLKQPDKGHIYIDGILSHERVGQVSYMYQKDLLLPWLRIEDNVTLSRKIKGIPKKVARQEASELFEAFGLSGFEQKYPYQLSGGMRQRAALLRTYLDAKSIILMDEPFGGLDAITKMRMQDWLLALQAKLNITILFVTHDIEEAIYLSHRIYLMTDRPSVIKEEIHVNLPQLRTRDHLAAKEIISMKHHIMSLF